MEANKTHTMRFFMSLIDQEADISLPWRHDQSTHECGAAHDIYCIYDYQSDFSRLSPNEADPPFVQYFDSPPPKREFSSKNPDFPKSERFFWQSLFRSLHPPPEMFYFSFAGSHSMFLEKRTFTSRNTNVSEKCKRVTDKTVS